MASNNSMGTGAGAGADQQQSSAVLLEALASVLPKGYKFGVYHLSTPPTKTAALCSAPPDERQDRTYSEQHFLAISVDSAREAAATAPASSHDGTIPGAKPVLVLALEIFIFTTAHSSTFFVAKADSTGYLYLLNLPKGTPSPIREISSAFITYLVEQRARKGVQSVVSLFARSQAQYLFPGSVENKDKHVLDDRGLVRWWCRVLNPLLERQQQQEDLKAKYPWGNVKGYLIIPGLDTYETRAFIPRTPGAGRNWVLGHPLEKISHYCREYDWVPPRCLIPRFPDDPKSRFRDELDEEVGRGQKQLQNMGSWKSVRNLDQFWEMMVFRQECSSGRMTGFIWVVFDPELDASKPEPALPLPSVSSAAAAGSSVPSTPPRKKTLLVADGAPRSSPLKLTGKAPVSGDSTPLKPISEMARKKDTTKKKKKKKLTGKIIPRQPRAKTQQRNYLLDRPVSTAYYYWPAEGRGQRIVDDADYKRSIELLLHLDFANLEMARSSTRRWIAEVGAAAGWALEVVGRREVGPVNGSSTPASGPGAPAAVNNLSGMIKRKRPAESDANSDAGGSDYPGSAAAVNGVNVLGAGLVRKKRKEENGGNAATVPASAPEESLPGSQRGEHEHVNTLGAGLVRKKSKDVTIAPTPLEQLGVNTLSASLVRKKPKT